MEIEYSLVTITPVLSPRLRQLQPERQRLREGFNQVTKGVERKLASLAHIYLGRRWHLQQRWRLRDPVDATISTLGRFWNHKRRRNDTLIKELAAARMGWRHVVECLRALPCERSLILSYELLGLFPHTHAARLAAFLGTSPTDEHMLGWLRSVRPPSPNTVGSVRASWEDVVSPSAPTASLQ